MTKATLLLMILLIAPARTPAQSSEDSWDNLRQLRPGQRIEVVDMKLNSRQGSFTGSRARAWDSTVPHLVGEPLLIQSVSRSRHRGGHFASRQRPD